MSARETKEWIADHSDQAIPVRVKVRLFEKFHKRCAKCTRLLEPGKFQYDHIKALINGGEHRESNLHPLCTTPCHSGKTVEDVAEKKIVYRKKVKHLRLKKTRWRPMPGTKASGIRKRMSGKIESW